MDKNQDTVKLSGSNKLPVDNFEFKEPKEPLKVVNKWDDKNIVMFNEVNDELIVDDPKKVYIANYPFNDLKIGQGFFVSNEKEQTNAKAIEAMRKEVALAHDYYSEAETTVDGDAVFESVIVKNRARNSDGSLQMINGKPVEGADTVMRPKLISSRQFVIRAIVKDETVINDKKSVDNGLLVVRVA